MTIYDTEEKEYVSLQDMNVISKLKAGLLARDCCNAELSIRGTELLERLKAGDCTP